MAFPRRRQCCVRRGCHHQLLRNNVQTHHCVHPQRQWFHQRTPRRIRYLDLSLISSSPTLGLESWPFPMVSLPCRMRAKRKLVAAMSVVQCVCVPSLTLHEASLFLPSVLLPLTTHLESIALLLSSPTVSFLHASFWCSLELFLRIHSTYWVPLVKKPMRIVWVTCGNNWLGRRPVGWWMQSFSQ